MFGTALTEGRMHSLYTFFQTGFGAGVGSDVMSLLYIAYKQAQHVSTCIINNDGVNHLILTQNSCDNSHNLYESFGD